MATPAIRSGKDIVAFTDSGYKPLGFIRDFFGLNPVAAHRCEFLTLDSPNYSSAVRQPQAHQSTVGSDDERFRGRLTAHCRSVINRGMINIGMEYARELAAMHPDPLLQWSP